jgi:hypothetical protein
MMLLLDIITFLYTLDFLTFFVSSFSVVITVFCTAFDLVCPSTAFFRKLNWYMDSIPSCVGDGRGPVPDAVNTAVGEHTGFDEYRFYSKGSAWVMSDNTTCGHEYFRSFVA